MNANFKLNGLQIETKRLILRPFKLTDLDNFYEYAKVEDVGERAGWKHHESIEESAIILNNFILEDKTLAIVLKENNKVIGSLGIEKYGLEAVLSEFFDYKGRELGYVLSKEYWGLGIMPEALKAVIDYLFNVINLDFLTCGYYEFNYQSKRVQEKCGFKPYRKLVMDTKLGTKEPAILNLLVNPNKNIEFVFSHLETLIYQDRRFMLGKIVKVIIDRPLGSYHPKHKDIYYSVNYGYIPEIMALDGEPQDVYVLGIDKPLKEFTGIVKAVIHRKNDVEDKLVVVKEDFNISKEEIIKEVWFQEKFFDFEVYV